MNTPLGNQEHYGAVAFSLGEGVVGLITPSSGIADHITRFLPDYAVPFEEVELDETYWIRETDGVWKVGLEGTSVVDTLETIEDVLNAVEQLAVTRLLGVTPCTAQVHAAGTVVGGEAIMLLGGAGAGKTSIALKWSSSGLPVLGDDLVLLDGDGVALPFRRLFIAPAARLVQLGVDPDPDLEWLSDEKEAWFDPLSAGGWAEPAPISTIALVQHVPDKAMEVTDLPKPEALSALLASLLPTGLDSTQAFERCAAAVQRSKTLRVSFPDSTVAADFLAGPP